MGASQMALVVKKLPANAGDIRDAGLIPGSGNPLEKEMATHSSILSEESYGQGSMVGYSPQGCEEFDMTEVTVHEPLKAFQNFPSNLKLEAPDLKMALKALLLLLF